jgi:uncharacterized protein (DUF2062 family)
MKKSIKELMKLEKLQDAISKYNIPYEYISVNRSMVTKALLIGLFIALLPIPMQMLIVLVLMRFFTFNVPLAILLCWITNPITMPFVYYIEYTIGSYILNTDILAMEMSIEWFNNNFTSIFIQLYVGAFLLASLVSTGVYFLVNYLWIHLVYKNKKLHYKERKDKIK